MISDILGINRRNLEMVMQLNPRKHFQLVDNKILTKLICQNNGIPTAKLIASIEYHFEIAEFLQQLTLEKDFVLKPAKGYGGNGIVVVRDVQNGNWIKPDNQYLNPIEQKDHIENILYGSFSLDSKNDIAFAEKRIVTHASLTKLSPFGLPDIRIILCMGQPIMSMLRLATKKSGGKANLHAGGIALGIDIHTGITQRGWSKGRSVDIHPDSGASLHGHQIPFWPEILAIAGKLRPHFPLDYMGIDFAIDNTLGPLILELNARPGLEIQNANQTGLRPAIAKVMCAQ